MGILAAVFLAHRLAISPSIWRPHEREETRPFYFSGVRLVYRCVRVEGNE